MSTTTLASVPLSSLTAWVREQERILAPGSESGLWSAYAESMREETGMLPWSIAEDPDVAASSAAWWIGAYCAALAVQAGNCDRYPADPELVALLPVAPQPGDLDTLRRFLADAAGLAEDYDESSALREGYDWHMRMVDGDR